MRARTKGNEEGFGVRLPSRETKKVRGPWNGWSEAQECSRLRVDPENKGRGGEEDIEIVWGKIQWIEREREKRKPGKG